MCLRLKGVKVESLSRVMCDIHVMLLKKKKVYQNVHFGSRLFQKEKDEIIHQRESTFYT